MTHSSPDASLVVGIVSVLSLVLPTLYVALFWKDKSKSEPTTDKREVNVSLLRKFNESYCYTQDAIDWVKRLSEEHGLITSLDLAHHRASTVNDLARRLSESATGYAWEGKSRLHADLLAQALHTTEHALAIVTQACEANRVKFPPMGEVFGATDPDAWLRESNSLAASVKESFTTVPKRDREVTL